MNSRERVLRAFGKIKGTPDRVPIQFEMCRQLYEHFAKELEIPATYTENLYEDVTYRISANELRLAMGCDVVVTGASVSDNFKIKPNEKGQWYNEYKMLMRQGDIYVEVVDYPLAQAETKADIEAFSFPDVDAPGRFRDAEALVKKYKNDYLIIGDIEVTVFSLAHQLAGMEKLLIDMMMQTEYVVPLFQACAEFQTQIGLRLIEKGVDALWFGDDFGTQQSLIMDPDTFRTQLKPIYSKMIERFKQANSSIIPILHCDGAVAELLNDIREIGFEVFNPVQPGVPGHLPDDMKKGFGDKFAFWGAIDQQDLLPNGSDEELEKDIIEKIKILGKGGGYMISPAHIIQNDVSPERVLKFIQLCKKHGKY
ncbi:uroporphyrinogen decarboxylase family protein [uncultured Sunxiuqinia sp.]|uniref:uroporphyrinogen decarboxylase family protein n=1 Tax=uncultured Sunxiuqinia sp. TaxID=1573825 RepID=UPI0030D77A52|tara:strand:- start:385 stop:1485 length:1101 start_codon:yes stop_codon:yes gene_type:complete